MEKEINIDEYLKDLQKSLDNGEEEKLYWQEDMQFLIDALQGFRKAYEKCFNNSEELKKELQEKEEQLNDFLNSYEFNFDAEAVLIGKVEFKKATGMAGNFDILIVNKLEDNYEDFE